MTTEIGDVPNADKHVEEICSGLAAMAQREKALKGGEQPSLYEQRAARVREREAAFHAQAAEQLKEQHDEFREPIRGEPSVRVLPPEQAVQ